MIYNKGLLYSPNMYTPAVFRGSFWLWFDILFPLWHLFLWTRSSPLCPFLMPSIHPPWRSSKAKEGIKVSDGIAASAELMTSGFPRGRSTKDENSLVGMILKALEILDNSAIVWEGRGSN